jgi:Lrp/AsnC family leucine-responsive transcriptional regulator
MIPALPRTVHKLDTYDRDILGSLAEDARRSSAAIAEDVNLSPTAVRRRIAALLSSGVIVRFTTIVAHEKVGPVAEAYVLIKLQTNADARKFVRRAVKLANVREGSQLTGRFDSLLRVRAKDNDTIADLVNRIRGWPEVDSAETMIAQHRQRHVAGARDAIKESSDA